MNSLVQFSIKNRFFALPLYVLPVLHNWFERKKA